MNKNRFISAFMGALLFTLLSNSANAQFSDPLYQCPFAGSGGDNLSRGFYVENYPSSTLGGVILGFAGTGQLSITLHARENTYDGPLIGSVNQVVDLLGLSSTVEVDFDFANAPVTSSTVTFSLQVISGSAYFDVGTGAPCTDVIKTEGTTPPLDTPRFNGVGVEIYAVSGAAPPLPTGITISAVSGDTTEAGGTATFTVVLDSQPTASVSIGLSSSDSTEGIVTSGTSVVFDDTDWDTPKQVTVTGQDDAVVDGDVTYTIITAAAVSGDGGYSGINAADVSVTNLDDNVAPPPTATATATPVPTMSTYGLILTMLGLLLVASRRLRGSAKRG